MDPSTPAIFEGTRTDPGTPGGDGEAVVCLVAERIAREQRKKSFESVRSFLRIGDILVDLRRGAAAKTWRRALRDCAAIVGANPSSLYESVRASDAFPPATREELLQRFDDAGAVLSVSHVIELARATPPRRARAIAALLSGPRSVRELRAVLRGPA